MNNNINQIVQSQTCTGCSTCFTFCPCECIEIIENRYGTFQPVVDESKCKNCGVCVKVCGNNVLIYQDHLPNSATEFIGDIESCYSGFSNRDEIRINSSSGGLITQLSIYCLENKIVDGVICVDKIIRRLLRVFMEKIDKVIREEKSGYINCNNLQKRSEKHQPDLKGGF